MSWKHRNSEILYTLLWDRIHGEPAEISGPSCSKLTTSLANVSLKFQTLVLQIHCYFLLKKNVRMILVRILCSAKDSHIFFQQKITEYLLL